MSPAHATLSKPEPAFFPIPYLSRYVERKATPPKAKPLRVTVSYAEPFGPFLPVYGPPRPLEVISISSPGPAWDLIGPGPSAQGEHIRLAKYRFNPTKADEIERKTIKKHGDALAALTRWKTHPGPLPPRPPMQAGVYLKD